MKNEGTWPSVAKATQTQVSVLRTRVVLNGRVEANTIRVVHPRFQFLLHGFGLSTPIGNMVQGAIVTGAGQVATSKVNAESFPIPNGSTLRLGLGAVPNENALIFAGFDLLVRKSVVRLGSFVVVVVSLERVLVARCACLRFPGVLAVSGVLDRLDMLGEIRPSLIAVDHATRDVGMQAVNGSLSHAVGLNPRFRGETLTVLESLAIAGHVAQLVEGRGDVVEIAMHVATNLWGTHVFARPFVTSLDQDEIQVAADTLPKLGLVEFFDEAAHNIVIVGCSCGGIATSADGPIDIDVSQRALVFCFLCGLG